MKNSHCSQIARALLNGEQITEAWLNKRHIRNQHKRLPIIADALVGLMPDDVFEKTLPVDLDRIWPIQNIGSQSGNPTKLKSGKVTRCGVYYLPAKYRPYLKKAINVMKW